MLDSRLSSSCFPRLRVAPSFEFALAAMSVQHKVRRRIAGQECSDLFDPLSYLTGEGGYLHLQRGVAVAMYDLAQVYLASKRFGQQERVEREQQLVLLGEFVGEFETIGDKPGNPATALGGYSLNSLKAGL